MIYNLLHIYPAFLQSGMKYRDNSSAGDETLPGPAGTIMLSTCRINIADSIWSNATYTDLIMQGSGLKFHKCYIPILKVAMRW